MPLPLHAAVITVSDSCFGGTREDRSGPALVRALTAAEFAVVEHLTVSDEVPQIVAALRQCLRHDGLIVTTGGTGLTARDVTPEATMQVCTRMVPGLAEAMRRHGEQQTPMAALSRAVCGTVERSLIVNLPGSPAGAVASLSTVLGLIPHALALLAGQTQHTEPIE